MGEILSLLLDVCFAVYVRLITFIFWFYNTYFNVKKVVSYPRNPLLRKSATELGKMIRERKVTSLEIIEAYISRIQEVNGILNAVTYVFEDEARATAKHVDEEISSMGETTLADCAVTRPLLGLPFTVKDSVSVEGKVVTVGIYDRKEVVANQTALTAQRMKDAGAILLAITTVPELCMWVETTTPLWGRTRNPYDSRRIVGGSSGGEGALQGAAASLMGIGSDIGGSVRIPSFMNGIFGFISSPGLVSVHGHVPEDPPGTYKDEMFRVGPMTRFAEDLPMLLTILSGQNMSKKKNDLRKIRLFFAEGLTHYKRIEALSDETKTAMLNIVNHFEKKYARKAENLPLPETKQMWDIFWASIMEPGEPSMAQFMKNMETMEEPICRSWELLKHFFGASKHSLSAIATSTTTSPEAYSIEERKGLYKQRESLIARVSTALQDDGVLFYPSWPTLPQFHNETILKQTSAVHTGIVNVLGMPAVQCPTGLSNGLPNGVMVIGNKGSEEILLAIAQEISNAFGGWVPPGDSESE